MRRFVPALAAFIPLLAFAPNTLAGDPVSDRFEPMLEEEITNYPYDSGWVPANSILQLKLEAGFNDGVEIEMPGDALYDWDETTITFEGDDDDGDLSYFLAGNVTASVQVDLGIPLQSDVLGPWDLEVPASKGFTPYLLPGNPDRPAVALTYLEIPLADEAIAFGPVSGQFTLVAQVDIVGVTYESDRIDLRDAQDGPVITSVENEGDVTFFTLDLPVAPDQASAWGTTHGRLSAEVAIHLIPTLDVNIDGVGPMVIGPLDLDVGYPVVTDHLLEFDAEQMDFDPPEEEEPEETEPEETEPEETEPEEPDPTEPEETEPRETDSGDDAGAGGGDEGCGCTSDTDGGANLAWLVGAFGLLAWRRRLRVRR